MEGKARNGISEKTSSLDTGGWPRNIIEGVWGEKSLMSKRNSMYQSEAIPFFSLDHTLRACPAKMIKPVLIMKRLMYCRAHVSP
jgi:hypothetical protein